MKTKIIFEVCDFHEEVLFGGNLHDSIAKKLDVSYSPKQDFVMIEGDNVFLYLRTDTLFEIARRVREHQEGN